MLLDAPLEIAGFGACMISGYPHKSGGLFEVACSFIEKTLSRPVQSRLVSLGGFPAPRAEKYFNKRVIALKPRYIVIQFGAIDTKCSIRATPSSSSKGTSKKRLFVPPPYTPPTAFTLARWQIASLVGVFWHRGPITPLPAYIEAIGHMVEECSSVGITPIVLSPFIFGLRQSMTNANLYTDALRKLHSRTPLMIFIDCIQLLKESSKSTILLNDGYHLSPMAHRIVGEEIGKVIVADIVRRSTEDAERVSDGSAVA